MKIHRQLNIGLCTRELAFRRSMQVRSTSLWQRGPLRLQQRFAVQWQELQVSQ
jgi:hypothetical protein